MLRKKMQGGSAPSPSLRPTQLSSTGGTLPALVTPPWTAREGILWSALAVALSASWIDLARHGLAEPWARPAAMFLPLFGLAARRSQRRAGAPRIGALLVAAGVGLSVLAVGGGLDRLGRLGIPLAIIGMASVLGRPLLATSLLALWMVPPPFPVIVALSPGLERVLAGVAAGVAGANGLPATATPHGIEIAGATLGLHAADGGLPLAVYFAGVGWWGAVRAGGDFRRALGAAARFALFGLLAQAAGLLLAFSLLGAGAGGAARNFLDLLPWPALGLALLFAGTPQSAAVGTR